MENILSTFSSFAVFAVALVFLFGAVVGSFLNVVILRYGTGRSLAGRSACPSCGVVLSWRDLVPVVSFVLLRARCRYCGSGLSLQYPLVELATGIIFAAIFLKLSGDLAATDLTLHILYLMPALLYAFVIASLLIVIAVYDLRHTIIPDGPVYTLVALSFVGLFAALSAEGAALASPSAAHLLAGPATAAPLAALWLISRGRWMGLGDAKLQLALGWFLGLVEGVTALMLAFWIGAVVSLTLVLLGRIVQGGRLFRGAGQLTMKSEIPFGPFLIIGFALVWLFEVDILALFVF